MVKLGIEFRLGKLIFGCFSEYLGREGFVFVVVMVNFSSIFCRVGNYADKRKFDCFKVFFCYYDGDFFILLFVYKVWEVVLREKRNRWCWENSINVKLMRRCYGIVLELENFF